MSGNISSDKDLPEKSWKPSDIIGRAEAWCAWQERCRWEAEEKLRSWEVDKLHIPRIIQKLSEGGFIDDYRYACSFTRGKFSNLKWGRIKIAWELRRRKIPQEYIVQAAMEIPEEEYFETLAGLIQRKDKEIREKDFGRKKQKIAAYMMSKGFEPDLVWKMLKKPDL